MTSTTTHETKKMLRVQKVNDSWEVQLIDQNFGGAGQYQVIRKGPLFASEDEAIQAIEFEKLYLSEMMRLYKIYNRPVHDWPLDDMKHVQDLHAKSLGYRNAEHQSSVLNGTIT